MHPFFRPKRALASAPESTPYQRAGQVWDDRMGLSIAHARNWRRIAARWFVTVAAVRPRSCARSA